MLHRYLLPTLFLFLLLTGLSSPLSYAQPSACPSGFANLSPQAPLITKRLKIAPIQPSDYKAALAIYMDPLVQKMSGDVYPEKVFRTQMEAGVKAVSSRQGFLRSGPVLESPKVNLGVKDIKTGALLGVVQIVSQAHAFEHTKKTRLLEMDGHFASTGYHFKPSSWGKGFASEGASSAYAYAFTYLGFDGIFATVRPANAGSMAVLEKQGFVKVAKAGEVDGFVHFFLSKRKFQELNKGK
jgi:RimJ/RimL family protein N-acetyltransferase